jgi:hypothetical protein
MTTPIEFEDASARRLAAGSEDTANLLSEDKLTEIGLNPAEPPDPEDGIAPVERWIESSGVDLALVARSYTFQVSWADSGECEDEYPSEWTAECDEVPGVGAGGATPGEAVNELHQWIVSSILPSCAGAFGQVPRPNVNW